LVVKPSHIVVASRTETSQIYEITGVKNIPTLWKGDFGQPVWLTTFWKVGEGNGRELFT
jgi:hypothetical protein